MKKYSNIFGKYYDTESVWPVKSIPQNADYLHSGIVYGDLVDIITYVDKKTNKVIMTLMWRKNERTNMLFEKYKAKKENNINED